MKKISLKKLNLKDVEQLSREQLKEVLGGSVGASGSDCGGNARYDPYTFRCVCNAGYYYSYPHNACIVATGSGPQDPTPKITACQGKDEFDSCSYTWQGITYSQGFECRYRFGYFYCTDTIFT